MQLPGHMGITAALVIMSIMFGFSHLYQGVLGVAGTGIAGYILGTLFVSYGIIPVMILHSLIDVRVALLTPGRQTRRKPHAA